VLAAESLLEARGLQDARPAARVEGIARLPSENHSRIIRSYLRALGLRSAPGLRLIELGSRPWSLFTSTALLLAGTVAAIAVGRQLRRDLRRLLERRGHAAVEEVYTFPEHTSTPLPEEVKVEVRHMLDQAWDQVARQCP